MLATDQSDERASCFIVPNPWIHGACRAQGGVRRALWVAFRVNSGKHRRADSSCRHGMTFSPKAACFSGKNTAVFRGDGVKRVQAYPCSGKAWEFGCTKWKEIESWAYVGHDPKGAELN